MGISSQVAAHLSINLLADDTSRVKLSNVDDDPCSDYVNASYIPVSELPAHHAQDEADDGYAGHATPSKPPYCSPYKQVARFKRPCPFAIKYRLLPSIVVFHNGHGQVQFSPTQDACFQRLFPFCGPEIRKIRVVRGSWPPWVRPPCQKGQSLATWTFGRHTYTLQTCANFWDLIQTYILPTSHIHQKKKMALKVKKKIHPDLIRIPHLPLAGFMAQLVLSPH